MNLIRFKKFKMADIIWHKYWNNCSFLWTTIHCGLLARGLWIFYHILESKQW